MKNGSPCRLTCIGVAALCAGLLGTAPAQTSVATVPTGFMTYSLPATGPGQTSTTYLSFPLIATPTSTGPVASLTANSVTITGANWTANQFVTTPHYARIVSGAQAGRTLRITANTSTALTLDTTDNSAQTVALNAAGFAVAAGDRVEVIPADTLASIFGDNTPENPLVLTGGTNPFFADTVSFHNAATGRWDAYYFNTSQNAWLLGSSPASANNTVIPPDAALGVFRRANRPAVSFQVVGRVPEVAPLTKVEGANSSRFTATKVPVPMPLSSLALSGWTKAENPFLADTVSVWNSDTLRWDSYFQRASDNSWRRTGDNVTDQSSLVIPAGSVVGLLRRSAASGSSSFVSFPLPYNLN